MSFDRENITYKSLPQPNNFRSQKTVNFTMPQQTQQATTKIQIPINNGLSSSSSSSLSSQQNNSSKTTVPTINTEEFAKLDALLEDLLAEVEQPILLNKDGVVANKWNETSLVSNKRVNSYNDGLNINNKENYKLHSTRQLNTNDELERSVDWLNEQKERLRSRKELVNSYASKHNQIKSPQEVNDNDPQNYRKIKSKLDYYVTNSNGQYQTNSLHKSLSSQNKNGFSYTNPNTAYIKSNGYSNQDIENSFDVNSNDVSPTVTINGVENGHYNSNHYVNNKPPVSPNNQRPLFTPTQSNQNNSAPFRSLSTNPTLLRNITETDDMIEPDFDRYSQRSYRSNASTVQRSKYHTVSNDFVECTRPTAPTPVPTYQTNKVSYPCKRALSAPPTEMGKVVLQRMELKSPLTVRQGSVVPFERQQITYPNEQLTQRVTTPINGTLSNRHFAENSYNTNRVVLKPTTNSYNNVMQQQQQTPTASISCQPTRNVFLNRAYSETPRVGYTNGYETDSGLVKQNGHSYRTQNVYNNANAYNQQQFIDSDTNGYSVNGYRTIGNGYRTVQTPSRYNVNGQSGYETDSGLIKLRQVLDNRRTSSRNNIPIQQVQQLPIQQQIVPVQNGGYYYQNRSMTPSFAYAYQQQQQQQQQFNQYTTHTSNGLQHEPITQQYIVTTYPNDIETIDFIDGNGNEYQPQPQQFQYTNGNNGVVEKISGYISHDGRAVLLDDQNIQEDFNGLLPQSQSLIIQQQIAPSAYQTNNESIIMNSTDIDNNEGSLIQMARDTPSRLAGMSSVNNISGMANQLNQSQQLNRQDSRRSSATSLADTTEILRNHPKSVKTTQNYWYKPKISRDEAINLLKDKQPGTFLIRDSNNFPGAYGLALKVDKPPPNVQVKPGVDPLNELVRHFLIEPTTKGVRIKGCYNEPIFGSLAALVYQHSLTPLALPIKLILPVRDLVLTVNEQKQQQQQQQPQPKVNGTSSSNSVNNGNGNTLTKQTSQQPVQDARHLLEKGAACNVYYLSTVAVEGKNGIEAITSALNGNKSFQNKDPSQLLLIQFKVTAQGITLTDLNKKKFLRQHFPTNTVVYCAIEEKQTWPSKLEKITKPRIFGVITKPQQAKSGSNECHLFVELDPDQPAIAIVDFINRYLIPSKADINTKN